MRGDHVKQGFSRAVGPKRNLHGFNLTPFFTDRPYRRDEPLHLNALLDLRQADASSHNRVTAVDKQVCPVDHVSAGRR